MYHVLAHWVLGRVQNTGQIMPVVGRLCCSSATESSLVALGDRIATCRTSPSRANARAQASDASPTGGRLHVQLEPSEVIGARHTFVLS